MRVTLLLLLLACGAAAQEDPRSAKFREYYKRDIQGQFTREPLSEMRLVIVRGIEKLDCPDAARWLMLDVIPNDEAGDVVREAVRVLGRFKSPATLAEMNSIFAKQYKKDWEARALTLLAFGKIKNETAKESIAVGLAAKDPRVVGAACEAVGIGRRLEFKADLIALLKHKHWAARSGAALALAELRATEAMPEVFRLFCSDPSHRVRYDAWVALKALSLEKHPCTPEKWQKWWEEQAGAVPGDQPNPWGTRFPRVVKEAEKHAKFFGIPVLADRIMFVLDVSLDMNNSWKIDHAAQRKMEPEKRIPNFFVVKTRWDLVRSWVNQCLKNLPDKIQIGFVFFNHELAVFPETGKLLKLNKRARSAVAKHLEENVKRSGSTAMYEGLKAGWGFLKEGNPDYNFNKGCETILFVTDGQVKDGELRNKPDRLRDEVWRVAKTRRMRVHTVGLHNHGFALCAAMARDSGSLYVHAQEHGDGAEPQDLEFWPEKKKAFEAERKKRRGRK